ncbi:MAG: M3 family oligoendopeptidase [Candidatus Sumerlaeia bacterium]|nr:M3 family oligoendopeptidase [Candidatus Sumerlaeia bacterium]
MSDTQQKPKAPDMVWDLSSYFPGIETVEYEQFMKDLESRIAARREAMAAIGPLTAATRPAWIAALLALEELAPRASHASSYIGCLSAADSADEAAEREDARLAKIWAEFEKAGLPLDEMLRTAPDAEFEALAAAPEIADSQHYLRRARWSARHSMDTVRESLASDLSVDGLHAWGRLYEKIAGKLEFEFTDEDGTIQKRPMAQRRGLLEHANPAVRKSVFQGSNKSWERVEHVVASCLNAISGTRLTLYRERGVPHYLAQALHESAIERATLDAMMGAIEESVELSRGIVRAKKEALGLGTFGFQDLAAPLPVKLKDEFTWDEAKRAVLKSFARYPRLQEYCDRAFRNRWIEAEKRNGKRPGAFCTSSSLIRESRVFMTFNGTVGDVMTLAHELGHAFHNEVMKDLRNMRRYYPMTLAETASTFAEAMLVSELVDSPDTSPETKAYLLDAGITHGAAFLLDIPMRFYFEDALYAERSSGELSVTRIKELMVAAQKRSFGDTLDADGFDPFFWASKLHFYITGVSFYNFPYTFGYLFSRALSERFRAEGPSFAAKYEAALEATGSRPAEEISLEVLGEDMRTRAFWKRVVDSHARDLGTYRDVVASLKK